MVFQTNPSTPPAAKGVPGPDKNSKSTVAIVRSINIERSFKRFSPTPEIRKFVCKEIRKTGLPPVS
jgi:hypothetical protein